MTGPVRGRRGALRGGFALVTATVAALIPALGSAQASPHASGAVPTPTQTPTPLPPELVTSLPGAALRGSAAMRFLGLALYDLRLWSPGPLVGDGAAQPLALELVYARNLVGARIAGRSLDEMRGIGTVSETQAASWLAAMTALFPDVVAGDRLTGLQQPGKSAQFFFNGQRRGEVADADFTRLFFGIWLSPRSSEPKLRAQLLGLKG